MNRASARIVIAYIILGGLWIILSDAILFQWIGLENPLHHWFLESAKGIIYVLFTGVLLYFLIRFFVKKLQRSESDFRNLFLKSPYPVLIYDLKSKAILEASHSAEELYGYSRVEFKDMKINDIKAEKISDIQAVKSGSEDDLDFAGKWKHYTRKDEEVILDVYSKRTEFKERPARLVFLVDRTEESRAIDKEINIRKHLKSLVDSQTSFLIRLNEKGEIIYRNKAFAEYTQKMGIEPQKFTDLMVEDSPGNVMNQIIGSQESLIRHSLEMQDHTESAFIDWEFIKIGKHEGENVIQGVGVNQTEKTRALRDLREYKSRLESILTHVNEIIWCSNVTENELVYLSNAIEDISGFSSEEFEHGIVKMSQLVIEEDWVRILKNYAKAETGQYYTHEYRIKSKQGNLIHLRENFSVYEKDGQRFLTAVATDITHVINTEAQLEDYAERLVNILNSTSEQFFALDEDFRFEFINKEFEKLVGLKHEQVKGINLFQLFPQMKNSKFEKNFKRVLNEQKRFAFETIMQPQNIWYQVKAYPTNEGLGVHLQDISEQKRVQEEINQAREQMIALINNTDDLICSFDNTYSLIYGNNAFKQFYERQGKHAIKEGENVMEHLLPERKEVLMPIVAKLLSEGGKEVIEQNFVRDDEIITYEISLNAYKSNLGLVQGITLFARDISERKRQLALVKEKNDMLHDMAMLQSHQIRKPVSNLLGLFKIIKKEDDPKKQKENLKMLEKSTNELDSITKEIVKKIGKADLS